MNNTS